MSTEQDQLILDPSILYKQSYYRANGKLNRNLVKVPSTPPSQPGIINNPSRFTFQLPSTQRVLGDLRMKINISASGTGGTYIRLRNNIKGIISQLILRIGGREAYNCLNWGRLRVLEDVANHDDQWAKTVGAALIGVGSQAQRGAWVTGRDYLISMSFGGLLAIPFPTELIGQNNVLQIEILPYNANQILETDHTAYSYTINSCMMEVDYLEESDDSYKRIQSLLDSQGSISLPYQWENMAEVGYLAANQTTIQYNIQEKARSLNKVVHVYQNQASESNPAVNDVFETFPYSTTTNFQYNYSGHLLPQQTVDCTNGAVEAYEQLLWTYDNEKYAENLWASGPKFLGSDYTNDRFILGFRFSSPLVDEKGGLSRPLMGSGLNTSIGSSNFYINVTKTGENVAYNLMTATFSDALLVIQADGSIELFK